MEAKLLRNKSLTIKVEKEEGSSERPIEIFEVDDSVTIKAEKEEDSHSSIDTIEEEVDLSSEGSDHEDHHHHQQQQQQQ